MNDLIFSFNIIAPIFILLILGYFLKTKGMFNDEFLRIANIFTFKVLLPVLLFTNVFTTDILAALNVKVIAYSLLSVIAIFLLLLVIIPLFEKDKKRIGVMIQAIFRSNFILFGVPLASAMYGEQGAAMAAVVAAFYVPLINILSTLSLFLFSDAKDKNIKKSLLEIIRNPLVIGGFGGIIFSLLRSALNISLADIPPFILTTLDYIKGAATPIAFVILGADLKFSSLLKHAKHIIIGCLGKLVIIPALGLLLAVGMNFQGLDYALMLAIFATPNAVSSYAMARNFEADYELAGELVAASTIFSMITIFIFIYASRLLGFI